MRRSATSSTPSRYRRSLARGGWRTPWAGDIRPVVAAAPRRATRARAASITWRTGTTSGARPTCGPIGWRATWPRPTPTSTGDTGIRNRDALYVRVPTGAHRARRRRGSRAWRPRQEAHWRFSGETPRDRAERMTFETGHRDPSVPGPSRRERARAPCGRPGGRQHDKGNEQQWDSKRHGRWDIRDRSGLQPMAPPLACRFPSPRGGRTVFIVGFWRALRGAACRGCAISGPVAPDRP